jgi:hypothetical protein
VKLASGPNYASTLLDAGGNAYKSLTDNFEDTSIKLQRLDEVIIDCDIVTGNQAQLRYGIRGIYGPPLPIKVGLSARSELAKFGYDEVQFRNATPGSDAGIIVEVQGLPG